MWMSSQTAPPEEAPESLVPQATTTHESAATKAAGTSHIPIVFFRMVPRSMIPILSSRRLAARVKSSQMRLY